MFFHTYLQSLAYYCLRFVLYDSCCFAHSCAARLSRNSWVFWFRQQAPGGGKISTTNYEHSIRRVATVSSVESFWALFSRVRRPSEATPTTDYMIFHNAIRRPVWEDPLNAAGGKWILRLKKGVSDRLWEDLVLGVVGGQFEDAENDAELCGITISVRPTEDIISVWHRTTADPKAVERIRDTVRRVLSLPSVTVMDYKSNNGAYALLLLILFDSLCSCVNLDRSTPQTPLPTSPRSATHFTTAHPCPPRLTARHLLDSRSADYHRVCGIILYLCFCSRYRRSVVSCSSTCKPRTNILESLTNRCTIPPLTLFVFMCRTFRSSLFVVQCHYRRNLLRKSVVRHRSEFSVDTRLLRGGVRPCSPG